MATSQTVVRFGCRYERVIYTPPPRKFRYRNAKDIQPYAQVYERDPYSQQQNFLYKRALFGLSVYTQEEIETMHWQKRKRIQKVHKRTQRELNLWKQELINDWTNKLFNTLFPDQNITRYLIGEGSFVDSEFKSTVSFPDLGIQKEDIITKLISAGTLPANFNTLGKRQVKGVPRPKKKAS